MALSGETAHTAKKPRQRSSGARFSAPGLRRESSCGMLAGRDKNTPLNLTEHLETKHTVTFHSAVTSILRPSRGDSLSDSGDRALSTQALESNTTKVPRCHTNRNLLILQRSSASVASRTANLQPPQHRKACLRAAQVEVVPGLPGNR